MSQDRPCNNDRRSVAFSDSRSVGSEPSVRAVFAPQSVFQVKRCIAGVIIHMLTESIQRRLLVFRMQLVAPGIEHVREVVLVFIAEEASELLAPPERIVRIGRISADHIHAPAAFRKRTVDGIVTLRFDLQLSGLLHREPPMCNLSENLRQKNTAV